MILITDKDLLKLLHKKPEKGLGKLLDLYMGLVYSIVWDKLATLFSREDIEECVSDIFYEFYLNLDSLDLRKGTIKAFLATMAKRRAIDYFRKARLGVGKTVSLEGLENIIPTGTVEESVLQGELGNALVAGIKYLGEPDSEIFIRKYYLGQSTKTIAQALDIKENTIDKKVSRGLGKLKQILGGAT